MQGEAQGQLVDRGLRSQRGGQRTATLVPGPGVVVPMQGWVGALGEVGRRVELGGREGAAEVGGERAAREQRRDWEGGCQRRTSS